MEDTIAMYQTILNLMESETSSIEHALLQIDFFKAKFLKMERRRTERHIMLKVIEYLLETLNDWKQDGPETTIYRRIATIFDFMFRDTHVNLEDGETTCDCSKNVRQYNCIVFGSSPSPSTGRQFLGRGIDLLVRYGKNSKVLELSRNEFKKPTITTSDAITNNAKIYVGSIDSVKDGIH